MSDKKFDQVEFQIGDGGGPEAFARACSVMSFDGPTKSRAAVETTALCDAAATYTSGVLKNGTITLNLKRSTDEDDFNALSAAIDAGDAINCRLVDTSVSPNTYMGFAAIVTELKTYGVAIDQAVTASATLQTSGVITEGTVP